MNLTVTVASTDRTNYISWPSFVKEDVINNQVDTLSFETKKYGSKTWKPAVGDEIQVVDGSDKIFAGVIVRVEETIEGMLLKYRVECKDWTHYLDKALVIERYEDKTISEIITDINTNYLSGLGFTLNNVNCDIEIKSIAFNRLTVSRCLQLLAEQTNHYWYVDYDKDIHFFAKLNENAPFDLTDTNGNYVFNSLKIIDDLSQIRNRVFVEGGEIEGSSRTSDHTGDGNQLLFPTEYKFAKKPTVTVNSVSQDVGVDFLDQEADHDCFWSYQEKYIRFKTAPGNGLAVVITGTPLYPVVSQVQDDDSIDEYGEYEHSFKDKKISSEEEARQYGNSQLEAFASKIIEAQFDTYESGLRSGQTINIQSDIRSLDTDFLIQRVTLQMRTPTEGVWIVELATIKTVKGIIEFLQGLLSDREIKIDDDVVLKKNYIDSQNVDVTEEVSQHTPYEDYQGVDVDEDISKDPLGAGVEFTWVLAPHVPSGHTDTDREGRLDISMKVY